MEQENDMPEWWCGCGDPNGAAEALRDILGIYGIVDSERPDFFYLNLKRATEVRNKYGNALELLLYLLGHVGIIEHSGSVNSSSYLTDDGISLRDKLGKICPPTNV